MQTTILDFLKDPLLTSTVLLWQCSSNAVLLVRSDCTHFLSRWDFNWERLNPNGWTKVNMNPRRIYTPPLGPLEPRLTSEVGARPGGCDFLIVQYFHR